MTREAAKQGDLLWTPSPARIAEARLTDFLRWLEAERGLAFADYGALWRWSVQEIEAFWQAIWDYFEIQSSTPHTCVLEARVMPGARWFPGARLNYAEHALRPARGGEAALLFASEDQPLRAISWDELAGKVRRLATSLRELGVGPGDRVASYVTNRPEAVVAMLAATSIGAIWSSCSPDFGAQGVLDRLQQLEPRLLFCVDGYRYGGKVFDRRVEIAAIAGAIPSLQHIVHVPFDASAAIESDLPVTPWAALLEQPPVSASAFKFAPLPFDHPLWILFSSGTTGLPKAIVHSHGGILIEMLKALAFHFDLRAGDRGFFYTTTGWMMWNFVASMLLAGVTPVLYDGNPAYPQPDALWKLAQDSKASLMGASPAFVDGMIKAGVAPRERHDLSALRTVVVAGAPVSPEQHAWLYDNVKSDLATSTGTGGTDICSGFTGGVAIQPVYAGEMQARCLGVAAYAFDEAGREVTDEVGELVVTQPMPSMPVRFWNDPGDVRYRETYFDMYPGVWRQGDFFRINARGGCFVLGRSDATLNRGGIRIGTAEIYRVVEALDFVESALVVHVDRAGGEAFMPLFVKTRGAPLDDTQRAAIRQAIRTQFTPRHVPDDIIEAPDIPMTLTGKKLEVPVRRILSGAPPEKAANVNAMANPDSLRFFAAYAKAL
ncbi:MAG: acetoacetate--CoA ligase [Hydrogenophilaceae bacterium]|jgi:acetoacetyl-CoA synthetase|nr:acetoacetate--CoA ligase [Hydrogenophilaceae bacterium]